MHMTISGNVETAAYWPADGLTPEPAPTTWPSGVAA
jgi:hypothetical protein